MMGASSDHNDNGASDPSAELGRLVAEMLLKSPLLAMNPTLVPHAAALAAATITGISFSAQMAGAFLGALQAATEVADRFTAEKDEAATEAQHANGAAQKSNAAAPVRETRPVNGAPIVTPDPVVSTAPKSKRVIKKTTKADDLKRISGIGPKLEQMLNSLGVRSASQIAAWTEDEVKRIDAALGVDGRIARDNWVQQAKRLAA